MRVPVVLSLHSSLTSERANRTRQRTSGNTVENITSSEGPSQEQLQRLLQSRAFRGAATQRELLIYLAEKSLAGEAYDLKEYAVGADALSIPETYDPRQDSSVRLHSSRLRQ